MWPFVGWMSASPSIFPNPAVKIDVEEHGSDERLGLFVGEAIFSLFLLAATCLWLIEFPC